ncbi:PEP-CTERM sorting domain-containing protein [Massilia sp. PAMC28688]|uniref:PEP-CTERM sorting domain-containing protein n=1 Tax=Massilia sp. PAMC28688 TaxID=2861283 RepID=UPI001C63AC53|nr:PEP-CTERM sorting domain-containing protein [Massilia sp. PAMC28688]QYF92083.1 PEP-CTERM sorting domain-containing protein [Massilia sp. PAMC28688]
MKTRNFLCAAIGALFMCSANAALVVYDSKTAFNDATTSQIVEPYIAPENSFLSLSEATFNGIRYPELAFMVDPGYAPDLYQWNSGAVLLLGNVATLSFAPTHAFAADFGTLNPGAAVTVTIDGIDTVVRTEARRNLRFRGWVSDTAFTSVSFSTPAQFLILDNVTRAGAGGLPPPVQVPEPGSLALMGVGLLLLARKRVSTVS